MKIANVSGRAHLVVDGRLVDVEKASGGRLPADPTALVSTLDSVGDLEIPDDAPALEGAKLGPPVPRPSKILALGLNYRAHAEESGLQPPEEPVVFTKLPSALVGPTDDIVIPDGRVRVDWEAELVVCVGGAAEASRRRTPGRTSPVSQPVRTCPTARSSSAPCGSSRWRSPSTRTRRRAPCS